MQICFDFHGQLLCNKIICFLKIKIFLSSFWREHVYEYIKFIRTILQEADQLDNYGAHLCATARNMMELFHVIYGSLHEKKAQDLPYLTGNRLIK